MFMDLKYHIVSLVAVFLALGIGVLIGSTMISGNAVIQRQEEIVDSLKKDFQTLSAENKSLKDNVEKQKNSISKYVSFQEKVLPIIIENKIPGKRMSIVKTNQDFDTSDIKKDIIQSGGVVVSETTIDADFMADFSTNMALLKTMSMNGFTDVAADNEYYMVNMIASYILGGNNELYALALEKAGSVDFNGSYDAMPDLVILVGGAKNEKSDFHASIDVNLIKSFKNKNVRVVGCENSNTAVSYMNTYIDERISTVDNIDMPAGRISLILLLAGDKGNYGDKETATLPYPKNF